MFVHRATHTGCIQQLQVSLSTAAARASSLNMQIRAHTQISPAQRPVVVQDYLEMLLLFSILRPTKSTFFFIFLIDSLEAARYSAAGVKAAAARKSSSRSGFLEAQCWQWLPSAGIQPEITTHTRSFSFCYGTCLNQEILILVIGFHNLY